MARRSQKHSNQPKKRATLDSSYDGVPEQQKKEQMQFLKNYQKSFRNSNFRNSQVYKDDGLPKGGNQAVNVESVSRRSSSNFFVPNPQIQQKNLPHGFFR